MTNKQQPGTTMVNKSEAQGSIEDLKKAIAEQRDHEDLVDLIVARIDAAVEKGFDGSEPYEITESDAEWIAEEYGREPTDNEWRSAVSSMHYSMA